MAKQSRVQFNTCDGVILRGDFYPATGENTPVIIMTQGLTLLKEHYIPDFEKRFQSAGYSVLIYDHRGWGSSDGTPRNQTDPVQQAEDYHDAVIFVRSLPNIDKDRVAIWGIGHSAGASMIAAGDDPYVKAVVLVMPFTSGAGDRANFPPALEEKVRKDRIAMTSGTHGQTTYVQCWDDSAEEASGDGGQILLHGGQPFEFISGARQRSETACTPWENKISLQSLYLIGKAEPRDHIYKISPRPLLYLAAITDAISGPYEMQKKVFERAGEPKEFVTLHDHHIGNYFGASFEANVAAQIDFLKKYL